MPRTWAQTAVIDACYVEKTGVIYRIDPDGNLEGALPAATLEVPTRTQR